MKLLHIDIETAPHIAAVWGLWDQNINLSRLMKPGYTLCWAAKWHGDDKVMYSSIMDGHKAMVKQIHKLMSEADVICHYNGDKFDIPTLNKEFVLMKLPPPAPSKHVDLLKVVRARFRLASNKLEFVAKTLGLGNKQETKGFELWIDCMARNAESFKQMEKYNKQDVVLLEKLYDRLLPWIPSPANLAVGASKPTCPSCGSHHVHSRGTARTRTAEFQRYQCNKCGSWFRSTKRTGKSSSYVGVV
jgi:DNA polymerase elongation subunit (family B)